MISNISKVSLVKFVKGTAGFTRFLSSRKNFMLKIFFVSSRVGFLEPPMWMRRWVKLKSQIFFTSSILGDFSAAVVVLEGGLKLI